MSFRKMRREHQSPQLVSLLLRFVLVPSTIDAGTSVTKGCVPPRSRQPGTSHDRDPCWRTPSAGVGEWDSECRSQCRAERVPLASDRGPQLARHTDDTQLWSYWARKAG